METSTVEDMPTNLNVMRNGELAQRSRPRAVGGDDPNYGSNIPGYTKLPQDRQGSGRAAVIQELTGTGDSQYSSPDETGPDGAGAQFAAQLEAAVAGGKGTRNAGGSKTLGTNFGMDMSGSDAAKRRSSRKSQIETDVVNPSQSQRFEGGIAQEPPLDKQLRKQKYLARNGSQTLAGQSARHKSHMRHASHFGSVGAGIIHGPSFINVYHNPVINPKGPGRAHSRGAVKRKPKKAMISTDQMLKQTGRSGHDGAGVMPAVGNAMTPQHDAQYATIQPDGPGRDYLENEPLDQAGTPHQDITPEGQSYFARPINISPSPAQGFPHSGSGAHLSASAHNSSVMTIALSNVGQARQIRQHKELEVRRMHNRIAMLQAEEEKALKRIEETRQKAQQMLETKRQQDLMAKERMDQREQALAQKRDKVHEVRQQHQQIQTKKEAVYESNQLQAKLVKKESKQLKKQLTKLDKQYLRRAQEKRFEQQVMSEAAKIKADQQKLSCLQANKAVKEEQLAKEGKIILKTEKQTRKLEVLESEVLKRLRDTHVKQQMAIEEIQEIFRNQTDGNSSRGSPQSMNRKFQITDQVRASTDLEHVQKGKLGGHDGADQINAGVEHLASNGSMSKELEEDDVLPNQPTDRQAQEEQEKQVEVQRADTNPEEGEAEMADENEEEVQQALIVESPNIHSKAAIPNEATQQTLKAKQVGLIEQHDPPPNPSGAQNSQQLEGEQPALQQQMKNINELSGSKGSSPSLEGSSKEPAATRKAAQVSKSMKNENNKLDKNILVAQNQTPDQTNPKLVMSQAFSKEETINDGANTKVRSSIEKSQTNNVAESEIKETSAAIGRQNIEESGSIIKIDNQSQMQSQKQSKKEIESQNNKIASPQDPNLITEQNDDQVQQYDAPNDQDEQEPAAIQATPLDENSEKE